MLHGVSESMLLNYIEIMLNSERRLLMEPMIRLTSITLDDFKNTKHGKARLSSWFNGEPFPAADVVGLYGQNGSGKTSVIQAINLFKLLVTGQNVSRVVSDCVSKQTSKSTITIKGILFLSDDTAIAEFSYAVSLIIANDVPRICGETLKYKNLRTSGSKSKILFEYELSDTSDRVVVSPKQKWASLLALDSSAQFDAQLAWRLAEENCQSLLFSFEFQKVLSLLSDAEKNSSKQISDSARLSIESVLKPLRMVVTSLSLFGFTNLAVVSAAQQADGMANRLHISTHEGENGIFADNEFDVNIAKPTDLSGQEFDILKRTICSISPVIGSLIPGLALGVKELDRHFGDNGSVEVRAELVCTRGDITIPLRCESEGIKKLVSIIVLLIGVYAKPGACVAIDEFDSGVFEFLLGEILQVLKDHGKGQLIFTAHNLRPLEIVNDKSLIFTTANPDNRYVSFRGGRDGDNLRSRYLRAINLGGQPEVVYSPTSKFDIDSAFYEAGLASRGGLDG